LVSWWFKWLVLVFKYLQIGKGNDHLGARFQEVLLAVPKVLHEMPRQDKKVIRLAFAAFLLGNDGNARSNALFPNFLRGAFGDAWQKVGRDSIELEERVALGAGPVTQDGFSLSLNLFEQVEGVLFVF